MKIKQMAITLFIFLSFIPLTLLEVANLVYYNEKLETLLENDLKVAVTTQGRTLENFFADRQADAAIICNIEDVKALSKGRGGRDNHEGDVEQLLRLRVQNTDYLDRIQISDAEFHVIASSDSMTELDDSIKRLGSEWFGPELKLTNVLVREDGGQDRYIAAVQAIVEEGETIGYLIIDIELALFEGIRSSAEIFNNGTTYMIDGQGQMIAAGDSVAPRDSYVLSEGERQDYVRAWTERDPQARIGILRYKAMGDKYMSCYMEMEDMDWRLISSVSMDAVLGYRHAFVALGTMIAALLFILMLFVNFFVRRYLAEPVNDMADKFQRITATGDYSIRMNQAGKNEIGTISRGINSLLDSIETHLEHQKQEHETLRRKAEKDLMTGLYNKETMGFLMRGELERIRRDHVPVACVFIDIDDFKYFNTRYGHFGGDQVLRFLARTLETYFCGFIGRQGGDEFIVMVSGQDSVGSLKARMEAVIRYLNEGVILETDGPKVPVRCSLGAVLADDGDISYEELIARSDEAMYEVKQDSKNGYLIWNNQWSSIGCQ